MVVISCPVSGCGYRTDDVSEVLVGKLLDLHMYDHSQRATMKGPKLKRPGIDVGVNEEVWQAFERRCDTFRRGSNIGALDAAVQLFECASDWRVLCLSLSIIRDYFLYHFFSSHIVDLFSTYFVNVRDCLYKPTYSFISSLSFHRFAWQYKICCILYSEWLFFTYKNKRKSYAFFVVLSLFYV